MSLCLDRSPTAAALLSSLLIPSTHPPPSPLTLPFPSRVCASHGSDDRPLARPSSWRLVRVCLLQRTHQRQWIQRHQHRQRILHVSLAGRRRGLRKRRSTRGEERPRDGRTFLLSFSLVPLTTWRTFHSYACIVVFPLHCHGCCPVGWQRAKSGPRRLFGCLFSIDRFPQHSAHPFSRLGLLRFVSDEPTLAGKPDAGQRRP